MEKILATNKNAEELAKKIKGFTVKDKKGGDAKAAFVKEVLIAIDSYARSYDAKKLRPVLHAEAFTGVRRALEKGAESMKEIGADKAAPDPTYVMLITKTIGEEAWKEKVNGPIYNKAAYVGFMAAFGLFREHVDETLQKMDTAGK